jgi:hypothetical protein
MGSWVIGSSGRGYGSWDRSHKTWLMGQGSWIRVHWFFKEENTNRG